MPAPSLRLRRVAAPVLAALLALAPAACDLDGRDPDTPQLQQQWVDPMEPAPAQGTTPNVLVEAGGGIVSLSGDFVRTCTDGQVRLTHTFDGSALTFRAIFTPGSSCATSTPTRHYLRYFGYLFNVQPGTYQVRVLHENDDRAAATGVVYQETLTVQ